MVRDEESTRVLEEGESGSEGARATGPTEPVHADDDTGRHAPTMPSRVGRYEIRDTLGAGGMGIVAEAFDPRLDRTVALKLLRPGRDDGDHNAGARMIREARALAALTHPNVVEVYEAGQADGELVFIAMELVRGTTLRGWLDARRRTWTEALEVFVQAGRGLEAAHAAGIVHRDFKPSNVLIGDDGRVRVMDFGLAQPSGETTSGPNPRAPVDISISSSGASSVSHSDAKLTQTGYVMGTPAYMSPEQDHGEPIDARADQYSYCVALYEAVFGVRPFSGNDRRALAHNRETMTLNRPRQGPPVPRWLERAIVRGLSPEAGDRFASMRELLVALDPTRHRRARGLGLAIVGAGMLVGSAAWLSRAPDTTDLCRDDAERQTVISEDDAAAITAAFGASPQAYAADAGAHAVGALTRFDEQWRAQRVAACDAGTHLDARIACLERQRDRATALVSGLKVADDDVVSHTFGLVGRLGDPLECAGATVSPLAALDDGVADRVREQERRLAVAETQILSGRHDDARRTAEAVAQTDVAAEHPALAARADLVAGASRAAAGDYEGSERQLERAYFAAEQARDDEVAFEAAMRLVTVVGNELARAEDGRTWGRHAESAWERLGRPPRRQAALLSNLSRVAFAQAEYDEALAQLTQARALFGEDDPGGFQVARATLNIGAIRDAQGKLDEAIDAYDEAHAQLVATVGETHPDVATVVNNLGIVRMKRGDSDTGLELLRRAHALRLRIYGDGHPEVTASLGNLGIALQRTGRYEEALQPLQAAVDAFREIHGDEHPAVASATFNLGTALHRLGRHEEALSHCARAVEIWQATLGPKHPMVATGLASVGMIRSDLDQPDEALVVHQQALDIRREALAPDHPDIALSLGNIGGVYQKTGRCEEAISLFAQQEVATTTSAGPDTEALAFPLTARGYCLVELGRGPEAVDVLERALALRPDGDGDPANRAETQFHLGRARWIARDDRARGHALVQDAIETWRGAGPGRTAQLREAEQWLQAHPLTDR
mgnify:CR=1 FL=1